MIASLAPVYRRSVAESLQLPPDSIQRLTDLDRVESEVRSLLSTTEPVSQVVRLLNQSSLEMLILVGIRCQDNLPIRRQIWKYITVWRHISPILNGDDLRRLGYKPGPQYRQILADLLMATLDGVVTNQSTAEEFVANCSFPDQS